MTVESLDASENLAIIPTRNENLCAGADGSLEDGEGTGSELMLLDLSNFILGQFRPRLGHELLNLCVDHFHNSWSSEVVRMRDISVE